MFRRLLVALPFAGAFVYMVVHSLPNDQALDLYNVTAAATALVAWAIFAIRRPEPTAPWLLMVLGLTLWVAGDLAYSAIGDDPTFSVADVLYVAGYASAIVALAQVLRRRVRERDLDSALDATLIGIATFLFLWILVVAPSWNDAGPSTAGRLMTTVYPLLDVVLLFFLVRLLLSPSRPNLAVLLIAGGIGAMFVADVTYAALSQTGSYNDNLQRTVDGLWLVGYALFPVAMLVRGDGLAAEPQRRTADRPSRLAGLLAAGVALVALPVADVASRTAGKPITIAVLAVAGAAIVLLVLARIIRLHGSLDNAFAEVDRQHRYYRAVADNSSDSFVVVGPSGTVLDASGILEGVLGKGITGAAVGVDLFAIVHPEDRALARALLDDALARPESTVSGELRVVTTDGLPIWMELFCTNLCGDPAVRGVVVNAHDITARKEVEAELERRALYDSLTGLANRALLRDRIEHALARRERDGTDVAVLFCDLDGFKLVNDTVGHEAGDELLRVAAERFLRAVRPGDTVARIGGDEFAALVESDGDLDAESRAVANRLLDAMAQPVEVQGTPMVVTASIGVAIAGEGGQTRPDELLRDADTAMYNAKAAGRNRAVRYEPSMGTAVLTRVQLASDLRHAVERGQLALVYQPIVALDRDQITGFEALLRWDHPTRGRLEPDEFIPIAEENDTILDIGRWVIHTACHDAQSWRRTPTGATPIVSVNVSARQLVQPDFVDQVTDALGASGLAAPCLVVELTESTLVDHTEDAAARLRALDAIGVRVAIDDFGVGHSSLSYLRQFPVAVLKLDRSFTEMITGSDGVPALVGGLLELARTLDLETLAEGIETRAQQAALAAEGCEYGQGYLFSPPVDAAEAARLLETGTPATVDAIVP